MGPSQICGCPFREPRVFTIAHMVDDTTWFVGNYPLVMTNIAMERSTIFNGRNHYKWAIYTMAMLNNQRVLFIKL